MSWRIFTAFIILFWAVMTGFIIRETYFPDQSRFSEVPVRMIFELFLTEVAVFNNTLDIYHENIKLGHTTFTIKKISDNKNELTYAVLVNGSLQVPTEGGSVNANFHCVAELVDAEHWRSFKLEFKSPSVETEALISWKQGDAMPEVMVTKSGRVVMNTEMAKAMIQLKGTLSSGSNQLFELLPSGALPDIGTCKLKAREGQMDLAGKRRRCYVVELPLVPGNDMKMYFSELGELARVEMPYGYRLIEPMMHGLEPGLKKLE